MPEAQPRPSLQTGSSSSRQLSQAGASGAGAGRGGGRGGGGGQGYTSGTTSMASLEKYMQWHHHRVKTPSLSAAARCSVTAMPSALVATCRPARRCLPHVMVDSRLLSDPQYTSRAWCNCNLFAKSRNNEAAGCMRFGVSWELTDAWRRSNADFGLSKRCMQRRICRRGGAGHHEEGGVGGGHHAGVVPRVQHLLHEEHHAALPRTAAPGSSRSPSRHVVPTEP